MKKPLTWYLSLPFVHVSNEQFESGEIPNFEAVIAACPWEFWAGHCSAKPHIEWYEGAFKGLTKDEIRPAIYATREENECVEHPESDPNHSSNYTKLPMTVRYLLTWHFSPQPNAYQRRAVGAWLTFLLLEEVKAS